MVPFAELGVGSYWRSSGLWMGKAGGDVTVWFHRHFGVRGAAFWERPFKKGYNGYNAAVLTLGVSFR